MKNLIATLLFFVSLFSYSQVSFSAKHLGKTEKFKAEDLKRFKETKTIFVLSNVYEKHVYEEILKDSWTVTSYEIVSYDDYELLDLYKKNYSFATLSGFKRIKTTKMGSTVVSLFTYFDIVMYDNEAIDKKIKKVNPKKLDKKIDDIFNENKLFIARFNLYPKDDFVSTALKKDMDEIVYSLYNDDVFFNYQPGMIKNYIQKLDNLIHKEEIYWMYEEDSYTNEITSLPNGKLYIPQYATIKVDAWTATDIVRDEAEIKKLYDNYEFDYEFIDADLLNKKILDGEVFFYLRYVRLNAEKFIQIVNSKTGEIIYRNYVPGLSYNIKAKHLEQLNKTIRKAIKKKNKA